MTQWEYKTIAVAKRMVGLGLAKVDVQLTELGSEGWELVAVDSPSKKISLYVLKRPLYDEDEYEEEAYDETDEDEEGYDEDREDGEDYDDVADGEEDYDDDEYDEDGSIRL